eukprot:TRINITY_DN12148_c0_g1_i1.p1 TRINITY_DN12148_c0_g1~~TRINITY_DN12148_c0_g1_i1.p1  ORF type:complete len:372 (-),score=11.74 TRINITY_DN12148_c0_g1_i1:52-1167(-)
MIIEIDIDDDYESHDYSTLPEELLIHIVQELQSDYIYDLDRSTILQLRSVNKKFYNLMFQIDDEFNTIKEQYDVIYSEEQKTLKKNKRLLWFVGRHVELSAWFSFIITVILSYIKLQYNPSYSWFMVIIPFFYSMFVMIYLPVIQWHIESTTNIDLDSDLSQEALLGPNTSLYCWWRIKYYSVDEKRTWFASYIAGVILLTLIPVFVTIKVEYDSFSWLIASAPVFLFCFNLIFLFTQRTSRDNTRRIVTLILVHTFILTTLVMMLERVIQFPRLSAVFFSILYFALQVVGLLAFMLKSGYCLPGYFQLFVFVCSCLVFIFEVFLLYWMDSPNFISWIGLYSPIILLIVLITIGCILPRRWLRKITAFPES